MDCTRVVVDSIKAVVSYSSEVQVPKQEWYANWDKVAVVAIIAIAIAYTITKCMEMYLTYKKEQATTTSSRESNKREWEVEDRKQKQDAELKERKLNLLKEFCYYEIKAFDGNKDKKLKAHDSEEVKKYLDELKS